MTLLAPGRGHSMQAPRGRRGGRRGWGPGAEQMRPRHPRPWPLALFRCLREPPDGCPRRPCRKSFDLFLEAQTSFIFCLRVLSISQSDFGSLARRQLVSSAGCLRPDPGTAENLRVMQLLAPESNCRSLDRAVYSCIAATKWTMTNN